MFAESLNHGFYSLVKRFFTRHNSPTLKFFYRLDCFILLYSLRILLNTYLISAANGGEPTARAFLTQYDPFGRFALENYDPFIALCAFLFEMFGFVCQRALHRMPVRSITWRWWYQLVVVNQDIYRECRLGSGRVSQLVQNRAKQLYKSLTSGRFGFLASNWPVKTYCLGRAWVEICYHLDHVDKWKMARSPLEVMPSLSMRLRVRILRYLLVSDRLLTFAQSIAVILTIITYIIYMPIIARPYTWPFHVWIGFDCTLVAYIAFNIVKTGISFIIFTIIGTLFYPGQVRDAWEPVRVAIQLNRASQYADHRMAFRYKLTHFLLEHNRCAYLMVRGNQELFGQVLLAFVATNIPINVYFVRSIILADSDLEPFEQIICWAIILCQALGIFAGIGPLALMSKAMHEPARMIPALQGLIHSNGFVGGGGMTRLKLKYDDLYLRLMHGPRIAITFGPLKEVTFLVLVELVYLYVAFLLITFSQQMQKRIEHKSF